MDKELSKLLEGQAIKQGGDFEPRFYKIQILYSDDNETWKPSNCTSVNQLLDTKKD